MVLRAVDGVVRGDVEVVQVTRNGESLGNIGEVAVLRRGENLHLAVALRLLDGLLRPDARVDVAGLLAQEVGGNLIEHRAGTAADVENLVVVRNVEQFAEERIGLRHHSVEILRTVRNREQGESRAIEIEDGLGGIFDNLVRKDGGSGVEIVLFHNNPYVN